MPPYPPQENYGTPDTRSASPTPSEIEDADETPFGFKTLMHPGSAKKRPWLTVLVVILAIIFIVIFALKSKIVDAIQPAANDLYNLKAGWLIPVGILIVLSFPPLFGHEIISIMVGVVWGIWKGFLIVFAGMFIGEILNWFVFKYACTKRAKVYEETRLAYGCLARVIREGGFWAVLIIRYSAIPGHFTTVVFSVSGISFWLYTIANILSSPKLLITVYIGVSAQKNSDNKRSRILSAVVIVLGVIITLLAARWVFRKMDQVRPQVVAERRERREKRRLAAGLPPRDEYLPTNGVSQPTPAYSNGNGNGAPMMNSVNGAYHSYPPPSSSASPGDALAVHTPLMNDMDTDYDAGLGDGSHVGAYGTSVASYPGPYAPPSHPPPPQMPQPYVNSGQYPPPQGPPPPQDGRY